MGQRLVMTIVENGQEIAKMYYHWGAYSQSALEITKDVIDFVENHPEIKDLRLSCIKAAEEAGGGISGGGEGDEYEAISKIFPNEIFKKNPDRNNGLVTLTQEGMKKTQGWSEGDITIDFDTRRVTNWVNWSHDELSEACTNILKVLFDFGDIKFEEMDLAIIAATQATSMGAIIDSGNVYYEMIY